MTPESFEPSRDFVARQYANLVATGMSSDNARLRLGEVLGSSAIEFLEPGTDDANAPAGAPASRLAQMARDSGGSGSDTQAALVYSLAEARLLALDWWRPIRTFLLYILFLLAFATVIAVFFYTNVLPAFAAFDKNMNVHGQGTAAWLMSDTAIRLFAPLIAIALVLLVLAAVWFWMRLRIARLEPLAAMHRLPWLYGRSGAAYRVMLGLEYASILHQGGARAPSLLEAALRLIHWPAGKAFGSRKIPIDKQLRKALELGTFTDELDWQCRLAWSSTQARLEMSRDRLILFSRVVFYLLLGYMIVVLYLPIFTLGNMFGVALGHVT